MQTKSKRITSALPLFTSALLLSSAATGCRAIPPISGVALAAVHLDGPSPIFFSDGGGGYLPSLLLDGGATNSIAFPIPQNNGVAFIAVISAGGSGSVARGSLQLQESNDGINWWTNSAYSAVTIFADGGVNAVVGIDASPIDANQVRIAFTPDGGTVGFMTGQWYSKGLGQ